MRGLDLVADVAPHAGGDVGEAEQRGEQAEALLGSEQPVRRPGEAALLVTGEAEELDDRRGLVVLGGDGEQRARLLLDRDAAGRSGRDPRQRSRPGCRVCASNQTAPHECSAGAKPRSTARTHASPEIP